MHIDRAYQVTMMRCLIKLGAVLLIVYPLAVFGVRLGAI
jgi:hypothetical protein